MSLLPKGRPTTSAERMRLKKLRDQGKADPLKKCTECGKTLKKGAGANRAWEMGLCHEHWKKTPEGKAIRRAKQVGDKEWGVWYFGGQPPEGFSSIRKAITASVVKGGENHPVFCVWNDGRVTCHFELTHRASRGLTPEDGDEVLDEYQAFLDEVPKNLRTWF